MGTATLFFIALGLSMDAFAVSITNGICYQEHGARLAVRTALTFGGFQAAMPLIGYFAGKAVSSFVSVIDHWIAMVLLVAIGLAMIREARKDMKNPGAKICKTVCTHKDLFVQGFATSIDAFAVGIGFAVIHTNIFLAVAFIGVVTFCCCLTGVLIGRRFGSLLKEKAQIFGGCILMIIGLKIFLEHMLAA